MIGWAKGDKDAQSTSSAENEIPFDSRYNCTLPRKYGKNLVVIEVKPTKARTEEIKKDLDTLTAFLTRAEYYRAINLVYGGTEDKVERYIRASF